MNPNYQNQYYQMYYNNPNQINQNYSNQMNPNYSYTLPNNYNFNYNQYANQNNYNPYEEVNQSNSIENKLRNICLNKNAEDFIPKNKKNIEMENSQINNLKTSNLNITSNVFIPKNLNDDYDDCKNIDFLQQNQKEEYFSQDEFDYFNNQFNNVENYPKTNQYDKFEAMETFIGDESDKEIWIPKFQNCECCKGFVYKCVGPACLDMSVCYCKVTDEYDEY